MAFLVTAQVESEMRFREYGEAVGASLNRALVEAAEVALSSVREAETRVGKPRQSGELPGVHVPQGVHLRDSFRYAIVKRPYLGMLNWVSSALIVLYSENPNAIWQERGVTRAQRGSVSPLWFMKRGTARAWPEVVGIIQDAIAGAGDALGGSTLIETTSPLTTPKRAGVSPRPF